MTDIYNSLQLLTVLSPFFLSIFFILISIFNKSIKGVIYLGGVLIGSLVWKIIQLISDGGNTTSNPVCSFYFMGSFPSYNSYFISFTAIYILTPMIVNENINWGLFTFFLTLMGLDSYFYTTNNCGNSGWGPAVGMLIGIICGGIWYAIFKGAGLSDLLYFDEISSDKQSCSRPDRQTFKCKVYKKGVLVNTL